MTFLLTKLVALKDFNTLTSFATSSARYDGTLPFRADNRSSLEGFMLTSITRTRVAQLALTLVTSTLIFGTPAMAGPVDTAFQNAIVPYVVLKRGTVECGKPAGEHIAYKTRMIAILGRIHGVDLIAADRAIERTFEREAPRTSKPECSDALLQRYQNTLTTGAEIALQTLNEQVRNSE